MIYSDKIQIAVIKEQMTQNTKEHTEIRQCISGLEDKMDEFIKGADNRFASKRTEQLFYTVLGGGIIYILYKIIDLI